MFALLFAFHNIQAANHSPLSCCTSFSCFTFIHPLSISVLFFTRSALYILFASFVHHSLLPSHFVFFCCLATSLLHVSRFVVSLCIPQKIALYSAPASPSVPHTCVVSQLLKHTSWLLPGEANYKCTHMLAWHALEHTHTVCSGSVVHLDDICLVITLPLARFVFCTLSLLFVCRAYCSCCFQVLNGAFSI